MTDAHSFTSLIVETAQPPEWTTGLERRGFFYEGYTDNLQETLNKHSAATVTTYGIRRLISLVCGPVKLCHCRMM